jgi:hypothetical protein
MLGSILGSPVPPPIWKILLALLLAFAFLWLPIVCLLRIIMRGGTLTIREALTFMVLEAAALTLAAGPLRGIVTGVLH